MFKLDFSKFSLDKVKAYSNSILLFLTILGIFVTALLIIDNIGIKSNTSMKAIAEKSVKYLNENILQDGQTATLISFSEDSGLIKIKIKIAEEEYDSYVTYNGKLFFPEALSMESKKDNNIAK